MQPGCQSKLLSQRRTCDLFLEQWTHCRHMTRLDKCDDVATAMPVNVHRKTNFYVNINQI